MAEPSPRPLDSVALINKGDKMTKFSSTLSTYLTLLAFSVGMSDIWRFPFLAFRNGGGAFIIPFVTMTVIVGIPLFFLEYSLGKFSGKGPYRVWDISPLFRGIGLTISLCYGLYMVGTSVFRCWLMEFIVFVFHDPIPWNYCNNSWNTANCLDSRVLASNENGSQTSFIENISSVAQNLTPETSIIIPSPTSKLMNLSLSGQQADISTAMFLQNLSSFASASEFTSTFMVTNMTGLQANISKLANKTMDLESPRRPMTSVEEFWQYQVLQLSSGISDLSPFIWRYFFFMLAFRIIIFLCGLKSIKSIEKVVFVTTTVPFLMTVAIFIRSLMLPGCKEGIYYFFFPEYDKLLSAKVWIEATLMAFYTLAFGWGAILLMGSHAGFKENCIRTAVIVPVTDMLMCVFSGLVCFSVLGNMAYAYDIPITDVINAGLATGMVAYVTALSSLPVPQIWAGFFFISMLLSGMDAQMIPIDMIMQTIGDIFPRTKSGFRVYALAAVSLVIFLMSLPTCTGGGAYLFLWIDWYGGVWVGPIVAFVEITVTAWIYGMDRFDEDVYMMIGRRIPAVFRIGITFVSSVVVIVIFCTSIQQYAPPHYGSYSYPPAARALGWLEVTVILLPIFIQAIVTLSQTQGPLIVKAQRLMKPLETWGPCDEDKMKEFVDKKAKYNSRTFKDLLCYNILGKYPSHSEMAKRFDDELTSL